MFFNSLTVDNDTKQRWAMFAGLVVLCVLMAAMAHAGTDTTFDSWTGKMEDWLEGSLGKGISIAFVVIGIIAGLMRQSLMAFAVGIGAALGLNYTPAIIDTMFTAIL